MQWPRITAHPDEIVAVDTEYVRPGLAAAHVVRHGGRAALVDTGTNASVPALLAALERLGIAREAVEWVFLTHVHLDHAGGAGRLLRELPQARAVVHPRGAPHLVDPAKLIAGSVAVYGEARYRELYGELVPIPAERLLTSTDGQHVSLAGREFELVHTPGHALHHHCVVDLAHGNIFTGDTFGLSYRELDTARGAFIVPTTTPTQFDPDQLVASIERLLARRPRAMYLTHYSRVDDVERLAGELVGQIEAFVRIAQRHAASPGRTAAIRADMRALWLERIRAHGCTLSEAHLDALLGMDLDLNAQGLDAWLERSRR